MTATILDEGLDTAVIDALDFQYAPQCEAVDENEVRCENEAEFILLKVCCGTKFLVCEDCLFGWKNAVSEYNIRPVCFECGRVFEINEDPLKFMGRIT